MELQPSRVGKGMAGAGKRTASPPSLLCPLEGHWSSDKPEARPIHWFSFFLNLSCGEEASLSPTIPFLGYEKSGIFLLHWLPWEILYGFQLSVIKIVCKTLCRLHKNIMGSTPYIPEVHWTWYCKWKFFLNEIPCLSPSWFNWDQSQTTWSSIFNLVQLVWWFTHNRGIGIPWTFVLTLHK